MKIRTMFSLAAVAGCLSASAALAETHVNVQIGIGNAPPPPVVVVREEPRVVMVPGSAVYVVDDNRWGYDCFHYGVYWYAYRDNYWYRARAWRGPFVSVRTEYVPRAIFSVPDRRWKHHPHGMPPGQARKQAVVVDRRQPTLIERRQPTLVERRQPMLVERRAPVVVDRRTTVVRPASPQKGDKYLVNDVHNRDDGDRHEKHHR